MIPQNILVIKSRSDFREWLIKNSPTEKECWVAVKRGKTPPKDSLWYLDAVEEALCFGWIDSTVKIVDGVTYRGSVLVPKKGYGRNLTRNVVDGLSVLVL